MKKELNGGLILRSLSEGVTSDKDNLGQFYIDVFTEEGDEDADFIGNWTEDLVSGDHPTVTLDDVWVVVDPTQDDRIVSALLLIPQTWRYETIDLAVGRVEIVATHKDYRRRGLVRALMEVAHQRSADLGHIMQGITGIQHYYRRFGYAMAIDLGAGAQVPLTSVPKLKPDQKAKYTLRPATTDDISNIKSWDAYEARDGGLTLERDWAYELTGRSDETPISQSVYIVQAVDGDDVGYVSFHMDKYYKNIDVWRYVIGDQSSYYDTFDDVLRGIKSHADDFYASLDDDKYPLTMRFDNGVSPAVYRLIRKMNNGLIRDLMYTWYVRIEDIPAFIKHIAPVLDDRMCGSGMNRFTGEFKISFYKLNGIVITFEDGCITDVVSADLAQYDGDTALPYDTFLNILFGHRTPRELAYVLPEVYANRKAEMLFEALFPPMRSQIGDGIG